MPAIVRGTAVILVVEDDPAVRATTSSMLRDLGYTVLEAGSGHAALAQLRVAKIDLVFSDVILPDGMSGVDLANEIRRVSSATPVLLTSGYTAQRLNMMRAASHFEVLKKPYSEAELSEAVSAALTTARRVESLG
jgi:CheY-like chemotaxis protein